MKIQSERSQHANKRLAILLLSHKLDEFNQRQYQQYKTIIYQTHQQVERGAASLVFYGHEFVEK